MADLKAWRGAGEPQRIVLEGRYARLEPLDMRHEDDLYAASMAPGVESRFRFLFDAPPSDRGVFSTWMAKAIASTDPLYWAVVDKATGRTGGRQALMHIVPTHGVIEIGSILWGPNVARTRIATEALYLFAAYGFDTLRYRRFEWKCDTRNEASRRAALRFGFRAEGIFRHHMVVKCQNRDTAWFAMTSDDWSDRKRAFRNWLSPDNFDSAGRQKTAL